MGRLAVKQQEVLILGEQAIGDTVMFPNCFRRYSKKQKHIAPGSRKIGQDIPNISDLTVYSDNDLDAIKKGPEFDLQIPCGSIPSLRLKNWFNTGWEQIALKTDKDKVKKLKTKYRQGLKSNQPLIGISWVGGGKSRKRAKSLTGDQFALSLMPYPMHDSYHYNTERLKTWSMNGRFPAMMLF